MNCIQARKLLNPYMHGLCSPEQHVRLRTHLHCCRVCEAELAELREVVETLGALGAAPRKPAAAWERIHDRVMADLDSATEPWWLRAGGTVGGWVRDSLGWGRAVWAVPVPRFAHLSLVFALTLVCAGLMLGVYQRVGRRVALARQESSFPVLEAAVLKAEGKVTVRKDWLSDEAVAVIGPERMGARGRLTTGSDGSALIGLGSGTGVVLGDRTDLTVVALSKDSICLFLHEGTVAATVEKRLDGQVFRVETPGGACSVVGTRFAVKVIPDSAAGAALSIFAVEEGAVDVFALDRASRPMYLKAGNRAHVMAGMPPVIEPGGLDEVLCAALDFSSGLIRLNAERDSLVGCVHIVSDPPGASVAIDGIPTGGTPLFCVVAPGNHRVSVARPGYETWESELAGRATETHRLSVTLKPAARAGGAATVVAKSPRVKAGDDPLEVALLKTGLDRLAKGNRGEALQAFKMLIEQDSTSPEVRREALVGAYRLSRSMGDHEEAVALIDALLAGPVRDGKAELALLDRARIKDEQMGDTEAAIRDYMRCLLEFPDGARFGEAASGFAHAVQRIGHRWKTRRGYQRSLDVFSRSRAGLRILSGLAKVWDRDLGDCSFALPCYAMIVQEYADSPAMEHALYRYASCLGSTGRDKQAREAFELYADKFPTGKYAAETTAYLRNTESSSSTEEK